MSQYEVVLGADPAEADYTPYGAVRDAMRCKGPEVMVAGPADTGKTLGLLWKLHLVACKYPDASLVIARKQLTDVYSTVLVTFQKRVLRGVAPVLAYGGEKPQWFDYPNGSRIWVAGLDKAGKVLSAEHDIIYVNQAEQLSLPDWETLTTRTTGRAGHIPYNQTMGDCNPAHPSHWIMQRSREGGPLRRFDSTHRDNPEIYDPTTGRLTEVGERRLAALQRLTGARKLRLFDGLWVAPEGMIYDVFRDEYGHHKVKAFAPPLTWPRVVGIDPAGAFRAAVWLAYDPQGGVINAYREHYAPFGNTVDAFVGDLRRMTGSESVFAWVCGAKSERDWRVEFNGVGIPVIEPPVADVWVGIDRVYALLRDFNLVVHDSCPQLLSEIGGYTRKERHGEPTDEIENKEAFHCLDALRYAVVWLTTAPEETQVVTLPWQRIGPDY